ncbi:MAG: tetratricopeptide repeat protein [Calditrichaeota bacterium]|nr:tetratricopeptide repeat protein [Calditrichota bacterium]
MSDLDRAVELFNRGRLNQADSILKDLESNDKNNPEVYYYLGCVALKKDRFEEAIDYLNKAIALKGIEAKYYEMLGEALGLKAQNAGMIKGAVLLGKVKSAFQQALELNPESLAAREGLFMIYLFAPGIVGGNEKMAMKLLNEIKMKNSAHGHLAQGMVYMKENKISEVETEFEKAAREGADDWEIQMRVGRFFLERKVFDKALEFFDNYIELKPDDPAGYQAKGEACFKMENPDEALTWFNMALEKDREYLPAYYRRALLYKDKNENELAKKDLEFILSQESDHPLKDKAEKIFKTLG